MVRDGWVLGATVLIYVFFFLRTVSAQTPGKYYTSAGGTSSTCSSAPCPTCAYYQYNLGCTGASAGTCANCTNAQVGSYYTGSNGVNPLCSTTTCTACPTGQYNPTCANASQGMCIPLPSNPPQGYYYTTANNGVTAVLALVQQCTFPYYNPGWSSTTKGDCSGNCNTAALSCPIGQYLANCGNLSAGTCQTCSNTPPLGYEWNSNGGTSPTGCGDTSCTASCALGQYISGCNLTPPNPTCLSCSNVQTVNVSYFVLPLTYTSTCNMASCTPVPCSFGQYLLGCGATPSSPGSCVSCIN